MTTLLSARVPQCRKIKNGGLDKYGRERSARLNLPESKNVGINRLKRSGIGRLHLKVFSAIHV